MKNIWDDLPTPFFILAPMEAVTDVVFRHVIKKASPPDVYFTEFTNATGWIHAGDKAIGGRLIKTDDEAPIIAQIWGGEPSDMQRLAAHCKQLGFHGIDINMGCPAKSAIKSGGSALIRQPELAAKSIAAAKAVGLPVSVKTRLGYSRVDEWQDWLAHLLRQDITNLTVHLRTKKELSKVPAHHELIPDIIKLRDDIAPQTKLTINGDIQTRQHGEQLAIEHPGLDGIMIGRGVFHDPFCFAQLGVENWELGIEGMQRKATDASESANTALSVRKNALLDLLNYHLDLHDEWDTAEHPRKFDPLKRFFKVYIRDFDGAAELRDRLMHTKTSTEVRQELNKIADM